MLTKLSLIVLRAADPAALMAFYSVLGLRFIEEKYEDGSTHYATTTLGFVLKICPRGETGPDTIGLRYGFITEALDEILASLEAKGGVIISLPVPDVSGRVATVKDPEGHLFTLAERGDKELKPPRIQPRIIAAPKHGQVYWCDFPEDAHLPEMWKTRPIVVLSYKNTLSGPCLIVPTSSEPQGSSPWAWQMISPVDGRTVWAVCNHPYTVAPSRFTTIKGKVPRVSNEDFNEILNRVTKWLPRPFAAPDTGV